MKNRCFLSILLLSLLLSGCHHRPPAPQAPIVRRIIATTEDSEHFLRRFYDTDAKMQAVLLCLRRLRPRFTPDTDPSQLNKPTLCLTLICADGSHSLYRIKDNRYLQRGTGPWKKTDTGAASDLWRLLWAMESDPESPRSFHHALPRLPHNFDYPHGKNPFFNLQ